MIALRNRTQPPSGRSPDGNVKRQHKMAQKDIPSSESTDDFRSRLDTIFDGAMKASAIAIGLETGLFNTMVELSPSPKTSQEIADAAGLKERYVREWLGAMVCARIVVVDDSERYHLPPHRARAIEDATSSGVDKFWRFNALAVAEHYIPMLEIFKKDGPLGLQPSWSKPYDTLISGWHSSWFNNCLCQEFVPRFPELKEGLEKGFRVLEVGCGHGEAARILALNFPNSSITGLDVSEGDIKCAKDAVSNMGLTNLNYVCADASSMPDDWADTFDYVLIHEALHDMPRADLVLLELRRVMKSGALLSLIDPNLRSKLVDNVALPQAMDWYVVSLFHCLPLASNPPDSLALGSCWGRERCVRLLEESGFEVLSIEARDPPNLDFSHYWCKLK